MSDDVEDRRLLYSIESLIPALRLLRARITQDEQASTTVLNELEADSDCPVCYGHTLLAMLSALIDLYVADMEDRDVALRDIELTLQSVLDEVAEREGR
jgi:hypothetical protein